MVLLYSPSPNFGSILPAFKLFDVEGNLHDSEALPRFSALLVMFICNHCPYVRAVEDRLIQYAAHFKPQGVLTFGICSNDSSEYPDDSPSKLYARWKEKKYIFPYLLDPSQEIAKKFSAVCTPDFFLYNPNRQLVYRGRFDDSWKDSSLVTQQDLKGATEAVIDGKTPNSQQNPSMGCSIKWLK